MIDSLCKNCKFWGRYREGCCDRQGSIFENNLAGFEADARVLDDSGLDIFLRTGPEFGCVHFQNKRGKKQ